MLNFQKIKSLRWYDIPNYVLNQLAVGDHAICHKNIAYGVESRQVLDLYVPHHPRTDHALIIFVHGGSWQHGKKDDYTFLAQSLAKDGFYTACMNYRFAPQHKFPAYVEDTIHAINWVSNKQHSEKYGFSANNIILLGHSAGAFNVLSAIYHPTLSVQIDHIAAIKAVIGMAGPYSFEHRGDPVAQDAFVQEHAPELIMPNYFVFPNHIQHLLLLADRDKLVEDSNTEKMQMSLIKAGNFVEVQRIPYTTHVSIVATLAEGFDRLFKTKKNIKDFIDRL